MLMNAAVLASLTAIGFVMIYQKLPRWLRRACEKYGLITDLVAMLLVYMAFNGTATALLAAAIVGIIVSALLSIAKDKEKYVYLYDLKEFIGIKTSEAVDSLNKLGVSMHTKATAEPEVG